MCTKLITSDNYHIDMWMYNHIGYYFHVFIANKPNESINSTNNKLYYLKGRDAYEVLLSDAKYMSKEEIIRMFF